MKKATRHLLATIIYRFNVSISRADENYPDFDAGNGVRKPKQIVNHMSRDILSAIRHLTDPLKDIKNPELIEWNDEVSRFKDLVKQADDKIASLEYPDDLLLLLIQGPFTDVLTHIGQLATISRLNNKPVPGQNFMKAKVKIDE